MDKQLLGRVFDEVLESGEINESWKKDIHSVWDNGGKTADRYTVVMKDGDALGLSDNPDHPQGFSQWDSGVKPGSHLGKKISFDKLPPKVKKHVEMRMNESGIEDVEDGRLF